MTVYQIAIPLPAEIKKMLQRICFGLPNVQWIEEENLHATLFYLGKIDGALLKDMQEFLAKVEFSSFALSLQGINPHHTKKDSGSLRVSIFESEPFLKLKKDIQNCLKETKIKIDNKSVPHVILGYFDRLNPSRLAEYLSSYSFFACPPFHVDSFVIMSARETSKRIIYTVESLMKAECGKAEGGK